MQKFHSKWMLLLGLVAIFGCEKDLEYDIPGATPQLVVNSIFTLDSLIRIEVSTSATPGQGDNIQSLREAKVTMFEDGTQIKDFQLDSMLATPFNFSGSSNASVAPVKLYFQQTITSAVRSGRNYTIEVKFPGLPTASATSSAPRPVRATAVAESFGAGLNIGGAVMLKHEFTIDDNGGRENHYGLEVLAKPVNGGAAERIPFFSGEKAFSENLTVMDGQYSQGVLYSPQNGVYFGNGKFKGRKQTFEFYVDEHYTSGNYQLIVRVLTLSNDFFDFATSYQKQKNNTANPFAEPTQVYSNIRGGLGIFAGYSVTEILF